MPARYYRKPVKPFYRLEHWFCFLILTSYQYCMFTECSLNSCFQLLYKTFPSKQKTGIYHYTINVPADISSISEFLITREAHKIFFNIVTLYHFIAWLMNIRFAQPYRAFLRARCQTFHIFLSQQKDRFSASCGGGGGGGGGFLCFLPPPPPQKKKKKRCLENNWAISINMKWTFNRVIVKSHLGPKLSGQKLLLWNQNFIRHLNMAILK